MEKPDNQPSLPRVEQGDILSLVSEEILDANHMNRWEQFTESNPILAQEIRNRAHIESTQSAHFDENSMQFQKRIIDTVTFTIRALEMAARRQQHVANRIDAPVIGGGDGEDQPLST